MIHEEPRAWYKQMGVGREEEAYYFSRVLPFSKSPFHRYFSSSVIWMTSGTLNVSCT